MTRYSGTLLRFKCPYHANVKKTFETVSRAMGNHRDWIKSFMMDATYSPMKWIATVREFGA
jgi:hypothetical protein